MLEGWCNVAHQSTEYLIIGITKKPTNKYIEDILFVFDDPFVVLFRIMKWLIYIKNNISIEVNLASQIHQIPHIGLPHNIPVINVSNV